MDTITRKRGDGALAPVPGGTATIYQGGTVTPLTIYEDDETTPAANPLVADANGLVQAKIPAGVFDVVFSDGVTSTTVLGYVALVGTGKEADASVATVVTCTTAMPVDDTVPQSTEGDQVVSVDITPNSAASDIEIEVHACGSTSTGMYVGAAVFQDALAGAIAGSPAVAQTTGANQKFQLSWSFRVPAGSTAARTYKLRIGPGSAGAVYVNGANGGGRIMGGAMKTTITAREVLA